MNSQKNLMSFSHFLLRAKYLKLYRDILRTIKKVPSLESRAELKQWVRTDFETYRNISDEALAKYHLSRGKAFHEKLLLSISLSKGS
ncbi:LYR motif-containing protein 2-like [Uloborus diversus]|uniref:LYR motif-containing protein 2-like n=1 Tax=Uloborus diversus TaxID=327109 RepID=UPI0024097A8B|nr:LYR motif-containing protein 2-like [Uloborus diversus]